MDRLVDHSQHLLIVDDDPDIRELLARQLEAAGYVVSTAADGSGMRRQLARQPADLIVLDLNLPREDGLALCRDLRARSRTPVIMLTARGDPIDRIIGLELGADDYLPKPFEPRELIARIKSVLRRATGLPEEPAPLEAKAVSFAGWTLDRERRHLVDLRGRIVPLSGAEFRLISALVAHAGQVLSRERIHAITTRRAGEPPDRAIDLQISRLRQKLGDDARDPVLIKTVRSEGYVLAAPTAPA